MRLRLPIVALAALAALAAAAFDHEDDELLATAAEGDWQRVDKLLIKGKKHINHQDDDGRTALFLAVANNHPRVVQSILVFDPNCNVLGPNGQSPLAVACEHGYDDIVDQLMDHSECDVTHTDNFGLQAIHYAAKSGHAHIVKRLIEEGEHLEDEVNRLGRGQAAIHIAAEQGNADVLKELFESPYLDLHRKALNGKLAVEIAAEGGFSEIISMLNDEAHRRSRRPKHDEL